MNGPAAQAPTASDFLGQNRMPYDAFDRLPHTPIVVKNATLQLGIAPGKLALSPDRIRSWVEHSATVVASYYGQFPVASVRILVVPVDGRGVRGGTTWAYRGAAIRLLLGSQASEDDLKEDWIIVHEMVHLALPKRPWCTFAIACEQSRVFSAVASCWKTYPATCLSDLVGCQQHLREQPQS